MKMRECSGGSSNTKQKNLYTEGPHAHSSVAQPMIYERRSFPYSPFLPLLTVAKLCETSSEYYQCRKRLHTKMSISVSPSFSMRSSQSISNRHLQTSYSPAKATGICYPQVLGSPSHETFSP